MHGNEAARLLHPGDPKDLGWLLTDLTIAVHDEIRAQTIMITKSDDMTDEPSSAGEGREEGTR